jgi:hypothetical protein
MTRHSDTRLDASSAYAERVEHTPFCMMTNSSIKNGQLNLYVDFKNYQAQQSDMSSSHSFFTQPNVSEALR